MTLNVKVPRGQELARCLTGRGVAQAARSLLAGLPMFFLAFYLLAIGSALVRVVLDRARTPGRIAEVVLQHMLRLPVGRSRPRWTGRRSPTR